MLNICTFTSKGGGNVFYKAISHPLAAPAIASLRDDLPDGARLAVYDPDGVSQTFLALYPDLAPNEGFFTQISEQVGQDDNMGGTFKPLVALQESAATHILALSFEDAKVRAHLARVKAPTQNVWTLAPARLPESMLSVPRSYLDKLNFATNFSFFRDDDHLATRLVTANYWSHYGATNLRLWFRLFDDGGRSLAEWEQTVPDASAGIIVDSRDVRERFGLPAFCGQLFIHVLGARGHDVVKYALNTFGRDHDASLSVTHDANAWPSPRFASLPAPDVGETVIVWLQNSHASPIPPGAITINVMGQDRSFEIRANIPAFGTHRLCINDAMPNVRWPAQLELRSGNHIVRPRYEVTQNARTRIAHLNVERHDLRPDPTISNMPKWMGRGFILPFPILDPKQFSTILQPNPMSENLENMPIRVDIFDKSGSKITEKFFGNLPRDHQTILAVDALTNQEGHGELVYDFRDGGEADGWLHAMMRYRNRATSHSAETSFGGHIFNTVMTWRNEPQSYSGPPPGLTTRLFLQLGMKETASFCHLIYPTSMDGLAPSQTTIYLVSQDGQTIAEETIHVPASGSFLLHPSDLFGHGKTLEAGEGGYILIRDLSCRLFGYHGQIDTKGGFSLDHMFGF